ncbi:MAG: monophosphatase [Actinomycetota bacterium]
MSDLDSLLRFAVDAAEGASRLLEAGLHEVRTLVEHKSSSTDMVTEVDRAVEAYIVDRLRAERPDDGVLGEEGSSSPGTSGVRWLIDPLDGTTNYLYEFPAFTVSIAAEVDGVLAVGVVRDPSHDETFHASRHGGAWCNGRRLQVEAPPVLASALVATGFSYVPACRTRQATVLAHLLGDIRDIRRAGAASLDLCWVAAGRVDAFYERGLQPWDYAAGTVIASEAGAEVTDLDGRPPSTDIVVAAARPLADAFRSRLAEAEAAAGPP